MTDQPHVVIVLARCRHTRRPFAVRFEEKRPGLWLADWAFAIQEGRAQREGYDRTTIEGRFGFDADFPGCPHCYARRLVKHRCGKLLCYDEKGGTLTCPWCGVSGTVSGTTDTIEVDADR